MRLLSLHLLTIILAGCANVGVIEVSPGTYLLSKQDNAGMFGNFARFKAEVIQEANDFAKVQGKVVIPVTMNETPAGPGHFATFQYQFRLAEPNDPTAQRVILTRQPDVIVENKGHNTIDVTVRPTEQSGTDFYEKLIQLDELRKRNILTNAEFESEKKKLLEQRK